MHPYKRRDVLKKSGTAAATVKADVSKKRAPRRQHGNVKSVALVSTAGLLVTSVMDLKSSEREMNVNRVPSCQIVRSSSEFCTVFPVRSSSEFCTVFPVHGNYSA